MNDPGNKERHLFLSETSSRSALESDEFQTIQYGIYPGRIPKQKCIVFEQCFAGDGNVTNDLELICHVGDFLGRDKVMVLLHPGTKIDRFTPFGFHTEKTEGFWETAHPAEMAGFADKVFVFMDSTASFFDVKLLHRTAAFILLDRLAWGGSCEGKKNREKQDYFEQLEDSCNQDGMAFYRPACIEELDLILAHTAKQA